MLRYVFKRKGSRVYRGRYRVGKSPKIHDVPLDTDKRHIAEAALRKLVEEEEMALLGIGPTKGLRDAAQRTLTDHLNDFLADLKARQRGKHYLQHTRNRLRQLFSDCGWKRLSDITADEFLRWRAADQKISPDTLNHYLGHANSLLNWAARNGRLTANPLRTVGKVETRGHERCVRRALTDDELAKLVQSSGKRGLPYLLAAYTGLRRGEIRKLVWDDLHLDGQHPYIEVRAATAKNKTRAVLPLVPALADELRERQKRKAAAFPLVFRTGVPSSKTLAKDLTACGIPVVDALGRRVDFHALRYTFATILARAGVPRRVAMELMRHSEPKSHRMRAGSHQWEGDLRPEDPSVNSKDIEPWLAALLQAEHVSLLVGSGLTTAIAAQAGTRAVDMKALTFDCDLADSVDRAAKESAIRCGRGEPNLEDQMTLTCSSR